MNKKQIMCFVVAAMMLLAFLPGCGSDGGNLSPQHEAITMQSPFRNMSAFIDIVHEKYPEINIEVEPYSGQNFTAYVKGQLKSGDMPDIYCTTYYFPEREDLSDRLINLAGYAFTDNYAPARLKEVTANGEIYLLPTYYECFGITYNKTLLDKNGWTLPTSMKELEELAPKVKAAGYNLCLDQYQLPGYGFQYLCNILDTDFLNTIEGRKWQKAFLAGEATLRGTPQMMESMKTLERWRDIGMLNGNASLESDNETHLKMAEGNTLFMLGSNNVFTKEETTDEFGLMPYLSDDGTKNSFVLNVSRYIGLNKHLEDKGNEQKLEDALHIMEVLSTVEGMQALNSTYTNTSLLPLKDYKVNSEGYYARIEDDLNEGATAPFIYDGWENILVKIGETMISFIRGEATIDAVIASFDDNRDLVNDNSDDAYTTVAEKIDTNHCAKLVGIIYAKASGADMALISKNKWYKLDKNEDLNFDGVSGALFPLPVTDQEIVSILPAGWRGTIETVTLRGARIKEIAQNGYDREGNGVVFPYELVTPDGFEIDDNKTYTVAVAGITEEVEKEGNLTDSGVMGLEAARNYLKQFDKLTENDIVW